MHQSCGVDDAGGRRQDRGHPTDFGFVLTQGTLVEPAEIMDTVGDTAAPDGFELIDLCRRDRDDELSDPPVTNATIGAVRVEQLASADAQTGLAAARRVVDPGMNDPGVA